MRSCCIAQGTISNLLWWNMMEFEKKNIHVWLAHSAVQQKLAQHCKSTILLIKNKGRVCSGLQKKKKKKKDFFCLNSYFLSRSARQSHIITFCTYKVPQSHSWICRSSHSLFAEQFDILMLFFFLEILESFSSCIYFCI